MFIRYTRIFLICSLVENLAMAAITQILQKKFWDYTILDYYSNTSDKNTYDWVMHVERVGRGQYAATGVLDIKVKVDDTFFTELKLLRSASGSSHYKVVPLMIPKQTTQTFIATTYRSLMMKSLENCSNLPQSLDGNPPVLETKKYTLNKCLLSTDKLPSHMQAGYYKVQLFGTSPVVNYFTEALILIENKL